MINQSTIDTLRSMHMTAMANELIHQLDDPESYRSLGFLFGKTSNGLWYQRHI